MTKGKSFNDGCDICSIGLIIFYLKSFKLNENPDKRPSASEVLEELKKIEKKILFYNIEKSLVISLFTWIFYIEELNLELIKKLN